MESVAEKSLAEAASTRGTSAEADHLEYSTKEESLRSA